MELKEIIDNLLKEKNRSLSWLAAQVGKTFDGFRLSLIKESVKYTDLKKISEVLEVTPNVLFGVLVPYEKIDQDLSMKENKNVTYSLTAELEMHKQLTESLKNQLKDKERIIDLLSQKD